MDVREKLVQLLKDIMPLFTFEEQVDYLIANGVTVQEWISVMDRLPEKSGQYFAFKKCAFGNYIDIFGFAKDGRKVDEYEFASEWKNVWYKCDSEYGYFAVHDITHWMPMPSTEGIEDDT